MCENNLILAGLKILVVAPPATHANKRWVGKMFYFVTLFYQYILVKTVHLFFILGITFSYPKTVSKHAHKRFTYLTL